LGWRQTGGERLEARRRFGQQAQHLLNREGFAGNVLSSFRTDAIHPETPSAQRHVVGALRIPGQIDDEIPRTEREVP
jgi:hypothetical protein